MSWTLPQTVGLVIGILLLTTLLIIGALLIYCHHTRTDPKLDPATETTSPEPEYALPGPIHESGTIRRTTGQPQTFYKWVRSSNAEAECTKHERLPSLKHGPGPIISSEASSMYSHPAVSGSVAARLGFRDIVRTSSLRDAVLSAGAIEKKEENVEVAKEVKMEGAKKMEEKRVRGYSGAWP